MGERPAINNLERSLAVLVVAMFAVACQDMDRLEPDLVVVASDSDGRGTILDMTTAPDYGSGARLTEEIAQRRIREITGARGKDRLELATTFLREYPMAKVIGKLHELMGDAYAELAEPELAAEAWEKALETSQPPNDILGLPQMNIDLPYQIGWAHTEAGNPIIGANWLTRATFISDKVQLEQGLRFVYAELGSPGVGFDEWFSTNRLNTAVQAPDFELPGYGFDSLRLSDVDASLTLINFWTPT